MKDIELREWLTHEGDVPSTVGMTADKYNRKPIIGGNDEP